MSRSRRYSGSALSAERMQEGQRFGLVAGLLLLVALLMVACGTAAEPTAVAGPTQAPAVAEPTALPEPTLAPAVAEPTPMPAPTMEPTMDMPTPTAEAVATASATDTPAPEASIQPSVIVADQEIVDSKVTIAEVVSNGPGWLVIHAQANGSPGPILGHSPVEAGANSNVAVELDLSGATSTLYAMLHTDAGTIGTFEFPGGPDAPVTIGGQVVSPAFALQVTAGEAEVEMEDFQFRPKVLVIKAGTTVKWGNRDDVVHTTTSDTDVWNSGSLSKGEEFTFTFTEPGVYPYYCIPHGGPGGRGMSATIVVLE